MGKSELTIFRGVGFLKYWTLSNSPLFLLASPMLFVLIYSAVWAWNTSDQTADIRKRGTESAHNAPTTKNLHAQSAADFEFAYPDVIRRLSISQFLLAILALTTYHVQIITRLSSAYPLWYWCLASIILDDRKIRLLGQKSSPAKITVQWMVCYALIQGGLFASFLPPA